MRAVPMRPHQGALGGLAHGFAVAPGAELSETTCTLHSFDDRTITNTVMQAQGGRSGWECGDFDA
jgi:hypothetical protein